MKAFQAALLCLPLLGGCDAFKDRLGIPDPARLAAEGKAIGAACRHAGRGLEDCYRFNPTASKPAIFEGWREMNEYMIKNNMQAVIPEIPAVVPPDPNVPPPPPPKKKAKPKDEAADAEAHGEADATAGDKTDAGKAEQADGDKAHGKDAGH